MGSDRHPVKTPCWTAHVDAYFEKRDHERSAYRQEPSLHQDIAGVGAGALVQVLLQDGQSLHRPRQHPGLPPPQDERGRVPLREDTGIYIRGALRQQGRHSLLRSLERRELLREADGARLSRRDARPPSRLGRRGLPGQGSERGLPLPRGVLPHADPAKAPHRPHRRLRGDRGPGQRRRQALRGGPLLLRDPQSLVPRARVHSGRRLGHPPHREPRRPQSPHLGQPEHGQGGDPDTRRDGAGPVHGLPRGPGPAPPRQGARERPGRRPRLGPQPDEP